MTGYGVVGASHDTSRDGVVTVHTDPAHETLRVLWTTGVTVDACSLHNVRPGLYAAWVLAADGVAVDCLHACPPALVGIARTTADEGAGDLRT